MHPGLVDPIGRIREAHTGRSLVTSATCNTLGRQVVTLVEGEQEAGYHEITFDVQRLATGVSFYRLEAGQFMATRRLLLIR